MCIYRHTAHDAVADTHDVAAAVLLDFIKKILIETKQQQIQASTHVALC